MYNGGHSRHTLPADKMISKETFARWRTYGISTQGRRAYSKRFHTRKCRSYHKQQVRVALLEADE